MPYLLHMAKNTSSEGRGPSQRQLRVGELIRRTLSEALSRGEIHDPDLNRLSVSIGEVRVSPDLRIATVYAWPLGGLGRDEVLKLMAKNKGQLRHYLDKKLTLRWSPDLRFQLDDTFERMDETRRLFAQPEVRRDLDAPAGDGDEE
jgi:ribosome-binding factor A